MRFMTIVKGNQDYAAGTPPPPEVHADILGPSWEGELETRPMMDDLPQGQCDVR